MAAVSSKYCYHPSAKGDIASSVTRRIASMSRTLSSVRPWLGSFRSTAPPLPSGVVGIPSTAKRPIGGFRGALTGFAFGLAAASGWGFLYLLQDYRTASKSMSASVQELEGSTQKVKEAFARVTSLEQKLDRLIQSAATKEEMRRRNGDLVRVYDALHEDVYEAKRKMYDLEQDVNRALGTPLARQANGRIV